MTFQGRSAERVPDAYQALVKVVRRTALREPYAGGVVQG